MRRQFLMDTSDLRLVDIAKLEETLSGDVEAALVDEYYRFGAMLVSLVQTVASQIETKLTSILSLACGMLVFLLFGTAMQTFVPARAWTNSAAASALIAAGIAAWGLLTRVWRLPSERDWFKEELRNGADLVKYHVVSL